VGVTVGIKDISTFTSRLDRLQKLSEDLCEKEKEKSGLIDCRNWVLVQLNILLEMSGNETATKEDLSERIKDIICVLDPEEI